MKTKELSKVEQAVETFVTVECAVLYAVVYTGSKKRDGWDCDGWKFTLKGESFEYFTGTDHRTAVTQDTKKRAAYAFTGLTEKDQAGQTMRGRRYLQRVQELREPQQPPVAGLLYSIIVDSAASEQSFASWCTELGYDSDSRKALSAYEACQENADKLHKVFTHAQISRIKELLEGY